MQPYLYLATFLINIFFWNRSMYNAKAMPLTENKGWYHLYTGHWWTVRQTMVIFTCHILLHIVCGHTPLMVCLYHRSLFTVNFIPWRGHLEKCGNVGIRILILAWDMRYESCTYQCGEIFSYMLSVTTWTHPSTATCVVVDEHYSPWQAQQR